MPTKVKKVSKKKHVGLDKIESQEQNSQILNAISVTKWLIDNTSLTFEQIARSTGLDLLDVNSISDDLIAKDYIAIDPITKGYFAKDDIEKCQNDDTLTLTYIPSLDKKSLFDISSKSKYTYTTMLTRYSRIRATLWIYSEYPSIQVNKVTKLTKVARSIAESIRAKDYKNTYNLTPQDPVILGICSVDEFNKFRDENKNYHFSNQNKS
jgi:hypothetical protein